MKVVGWWKRGIGGEGGLGGMGCLGPRFFGGKGLQEMESLLRGRVKGVTRSGRGWEARQFEDREEVRSLVGQPVGGQHVMPPVPFEGTHAFNAERMSQVGLSVDHASSPHAHVSKYVL